MVRIRTAQQTQLPGFPCAASTARGVAGRKLDELREARAFRNRQHVRFERADRGTDERLHRDLVRPRPGAIGHEDLIALDARRGLPRVAVDLVLANLLGPAQPREPHGNTAAPARTRVIVWPVVPPPPCSGEPQLVPLAMVAIEITSLPPSTGNTTGVSVVSRRVFPSTLR